jgi:hypothetical protein
MAEASWPSPTHNSRAVTEAEYERLAARYSDDGLYNTPFDIAPVTAGAGLQVLIQPGFDASLRGFFWTSGSTETAKTIDSNPAGAPRQDWVVLRLDRSTWDVRTAIREGSPGAGPPALVRDLWDTGVYEIPLALVTVPVGATTLTDDNVVPYPKYVGSRVGFFTGVRDPNPQPGQLDWDGGRAYSSFNGTSWATVVEDTGWSTLGLNGPNANAWIVNNALIYKRISGVVHLRFSITRWSSSALQLTDTDGSTPYVLPSGFRPSGSMPALGHGNHSRSSAQLFIYPNGDVRVYPLNTDLAASRRVYAAASFAI